MKLIIHVEDSHVDFLLELFSHLDFVTIETEELSEAEKGFIEFRLAHHEANRDKAVSWDDLKKTIVNTEGR